VPAGGLTHLNYAFANVVGGTCAVGDTYADTDKFFPGDSWDAGAKRGNFNQLAKLKAANPHLKTLLSVGGWTWSGNFSAAAATPTSRATFADGCVALMKQYGFDGLDIDWEYPVSGGLNPGTTADKANYTLLLKALDSALQSAEAKDRRDYLLTVATAAGPSNVANIDVPGVAATVDWINIMTYDYNGAWDKTTGHNAPLFRSTADRGPVGLDVDATVTNYLAKGAPGAKLVLGMPFYGRSWTGVPSAGNGLAQSATGAGPGTWEPGMLDYHDIVARYLPTSGKHRDSTSQVPYLYDPNTKVFISYDDPQSLTAKAQYAKSKGLAGAMVWELSSDTSDHALLNAVNAGLR
jgi:chitinase